MNVVSRPDVDHPWRATFMADPERELDRLLSGYARLQDLSGADPADVARAVFGVPGADPQGIEALDRAVLAWLRSRREEGAKPLLQWGRPRAFRAIMDALDIVGAMQLPASAVDINRRVAIWYRWADRLQGAGAGDVLAALLTAVAVTQRLAARQPGGSGSGLEAFWLDLASQAGSAAPESLLQQALLGLRHLPERDTPPERPWMTGLARWAEARRPSARDFTSEWRGLRALYPHVPAYWRDLLKDMLDQHSIQHLPDELRDVWQNDLGGTASSSEQKGLRRVKPIPSPPLQGVTDMMTRIHLPLATIQNDLQRVFAERERYAEVTGEDHFFVTTVCNLGQLLLKKSPAGEEVRRGQIGQKAARLALKWQPANPYAWGLWRDSIAAQGYADDAEAIGWALISRFPESSISRSKLSDILVKRIQNRDTARMLLTETLSRFPDDNSNFIRSQLAELLIATDNLQEAERIIREATIVDDALYAVQAKIAFKRDRQEAFQIVRQGLQDFPASESLKRYMEILENQRDLPFLSELYRQEEPENKGSLDSQDALLLSVRREGRARRLQTELTYLESDPQWRIFAISTITSDLAEYPESESLNYLAQKLSISAPVAVEDQEPSKFSSVLAAVLAGERSADDPSAGQRRTPFALAIADVSLIYLHGDDDASERVSSWLREPVPSTFRSISALRNFLLMRTGGKIDKESLKALAANDNLAKDIIETALIPIQLALAA